MSDTMHRLFLAVATICAALGALPAIAQAPPGNAAAGREVARRWCANCHVVEAGQRSGSDAVPTFATLASRPATTAGSLITFLHKPHASSQMPDFHLSETEIDDVAAYLLTQRR